jgi:hypothetical protein
LFKRASSRQLACRFRPSMDIRATLSSHIMVSLMAVRAIDVLVVA